eukprot:CAMPEP_0206256064 /NCGR_PEP_ID=MMETSP0047_2-20121206/24568_1 /ASSEMBLY_ACC=CAM_ASM_000192 /TAXON_ID=195065 /ORGANISM="Chroomonas mesostigmatica_cf, Strain CCMP1168" /LENGTH=37 /DNA_ID= /DNA_START= /DNA_END= /DNA_ORIENTATION=
MHLPEAQKHAWPSMSAPSNQECMGLANEEPKRISMRA